MGRIARILTWTAAIVVGVPLLLVALLLVAGNIAPGQRLIARLVPSLTGGEIRIGGLSGRFPDRLRATTLTIDDPRGPYLTIQDLVLDWSPLELMHRTLAVDRLDVGAADFARMPESSGGKSSGLPVKVVLRQFEVGRLTIGAPVAGKQYVVAVQGAADLQSMSAGSGRLTVQQIGGSGRYSLRGNIGPQRLQAAITAREQAHGLISGAAGLPDVGPIAIDASLDGPRDGVATHVAASAGPLRAQVQGTLDLVHDAADLTVAAAAPAMTPRPDISWQDVNIAAHVQGTFTRPELSGHVQIDALKAVGAGIAHLTADLSGNQGVAHLQAALDDLTLPGQDPNLLAAAPVRLTATAQLAAPDRPVTFTLQHPLVQAQGTARTAGPLAAHVTLTLPELAPVAAAAGQQLQGHTALTLDVTRTLDVTKQAATTTLALNGTLGVTGGQPQVQALLGNEAHLDLAASLTGRDAQLTRLHVTGRGVDVAAHGSLENMQASLAWSVAVTDLAALDPALIGAIDASGQISGPEQDLAATADLHGNIGARGVESGPVTVHIAAQGLPDHPSGTVTAQGALLNAPIDLALDVSRQDGGIRVAVQRADWKSLQAGGILTLPAGAKIPQGTLHLRMARLSDLTPLLHRSLAGSIDAALDATKTAAKLTLTAQGLAVPGTATVSRATLDAVVTDPQTNPDVQANLAIDGISASSVTGASARLQVHGPQNAMAMTLTANTPSVSGGPARMNAAATVDVPTRSVALSSRAGHVEAGDPAPAGTRHAELCRWWHHRPPAARPAPSGAERERPHQPDARPHRQSARSARRPRRRRGSIGEGERHDRGGGAAYRHAGAPGRHGAADRDRHARPQRARRRAAARQPARQRHVAGHRRPVGRAADRGQLASGGDRDGAAGDDRVAGPACRRGSQSHLAQSDPDRSGAASARRGHADAVAGPATAPRITGTARLAGGDAEDGPQGIHITDIGALVQADGDRLRLARFSGRAGQGTLGGSGTIGLTPPMPIALTFTADDATLLASPLINATLDSHMTVKGDVDGNLAVGGTYICGRPTCRCQTSCHRALPSCRYASPGPRRRLSPARSAAPAAPCPARHKPRRPALLRSTSRSTHRSRYLFAAAAWTWSSAAPCV